MRVIERRCGGWLAVNDGQPRIGVTAPTEYEARDMLQQRVCEWLMTIERHRNPTASDWETGQDVEAARAVVRPA